MSKLSAENKFLDLSDYGRPFAKIIVKLLKNTNVNAIHLTILFGICGLFAAYFMYKGHFIVAGLFLILKSILDAADGEMARVKNEPSYVGRYLDSMFDILLNFIFLVIIGKVAHISFALTLIAFVCIQLQGTLYNYYYVILRNNSEGGDKTSKVFENQIPKAFSGEKQWSVSILFICFRVLYFLFDYTIQILDNGAVKQVNFPNWFMTMVSVYGLGSSLLIMALMLNLGLVSFIIPFFIGLTILLPIFIMIRKTMLFAPTI
jgi:phosphatidylglycerophosphate synthase